MSFLSNVISFLIYFFSAALSVFFIKRAEKKKKRKLSAALGVLIPSVVAAFRESGIDLATYRSWYDFIHAGGKYDVELGWNILNKIAPSFAALQFLAAFIFFFVSYLAIKKFDAPNRWLSWLIILSLSTGMLYNMTRQAIAVAFIFLGTAYFSKKKYFKFLISVLLATLFHKTAIIMSLLLPLYWFIMKRVKKLILVTAIMSAASILCVPMIVWAVRRLGLFSTYMLDKSFELSLSFLLYTLPPLLLYAWKPSVFKEDKRVRFCLVLYLFIIPMQFLGMRLPFADRIMFYFRPAIAIAVPLMIARYAEIDKSKVKWIKAGYVLWFIFYHIMMGFLLNENGMYPYINF